jgi:7-cyano-7-deazaguanine synthase
MGSSATHPKPAVCLLSGGLDSATCLAFARDEGYRCYALSFDYGQRHRAELQSAARVATSLGVEEHRVVSIDLRAFGGSALTADIAVPKAGVCDGIPVTYVPARNTVFLSFALAWAEVLSSSDVFIGVNAIDYSGYPDCRPEFIAAFENMANLATKSGVEGRTRLKIHTPLIQLSKCEIIKLGARLGVDFGLTHSCYDPDARGRSCGLCDSCRLRLKGFADAGFKDPIEYSIEDL